MMTENNPHASASTTRNRAAKRELLEEHGDQNQIERYFAGLLPEDELLALARRVLFAPLSSFRRHRKLAPSDVKHSEDCAWGAHQVRFFTRDVADGITGNEWMRYRQLQDVVTAALNTMPCGTYAKIEIVEHVGMCASCKHREATSRAASVRVTWAGHELVREYALGSV